MTLDQLAALGEAIGGIAVVFTLGYLAYETRRNTAAHAASSTSDAYVRWAEFNDGLAEDEQICDLWVRVYEECSLDTFSAVEKFRITLSFRSVVQRMAAVHAQYRKGLVDSYYWDIHKVWFGGFLNTPAVAEWWGLEKRNSLFSDEFILDVESAKPFRLGANAQRAG